MDLDYVNAGILIVLLCGGGLLIAGCFLLAAQLPGIICRLLGFGEDGDDWHGDDDVDESKE